MARGGEPSGSDAKGQNHLRQAEHLFNEGLVADDRVLQHLHAAIATTDLTDMELAYATYLAGEYMKETREYEDALTFFDDALRLAPKAKFAILAHSAAGDICFAANDWNNALSHYRAALAINRDHAFAPDWLMCAATAIVDREAEPSREVLDESRAMLDEALAMLMSPGAQEKYVTQFPYTRAVLQCRTARATVMAKLQSRQALFDAVKEFREVEEFALANLGPDIGRQDLIPVYAQWVMALRALDLQDEAKRVEEHAERQLG